jgi:hypothetical protein
VTTVAREIARLRERGFRPVPVPNPARRYAGTLFYRLTHDGFIDTVVIRADTFAVAARLSDRFNPARPLDIGHALWMRQGDLEEVVGLFLKRFYPDEPRTESHYAGVLDETEPALS